MNICLSVCKCVCECIHYTYACKYAFFFNIFDGFLFSQVSYNYTLDIYIFQYK